MLNKGCFKKGNIPWNKGVTGYMGANRTSFKTGNLPHNTRELYSERVNKDGLIEIKVDTNKWISKHRYIWEQYHKREVPKGKVVIFLDGDNRNFDVDNLKLISRGALLILNRQYRNILKDKELIESCVDLSELIYAINKRRTNNDKKSN